MTRRTFGTIATKAGSALKAFLIGERGALSRGDGKARGSLRTPAADAATRLYIRSELGR